MLEKIQDIFFPRLLKSTLENQTRQRKAHTIESAHSIGILFDASEEPTRRDVVEFEQMLKELLPRKTVRILGFVDSKHPLGQTLFPQFTQKELQWNGKPKGEAVANFLAENFDLLLCLNPGEIPALAWIAAASGSSMKIGTPTALPHDFDMVLETPADKGVQFFVDQLDLYLNKIIPTEHYATTSAH